MEFPIRVALAKAVPVLPRGPGWWYEPKFDGHRMVLRRTEESVVLYARSGRIVTSHWMDLATAGMHSLLPGTVLDGEAVIWKDGRLDFGAVQSRAASTLPRARTLAARYPASYMVWDVLHHPDLGDVTAAPTPPAALCWWSSWTVSGRRFRWCRRATTTTSHWTGTSRFGRWGSRGSSRSGMPPIPPAGVAG
ncbi:hypothetical protein ACF08M_38310 [Streptomyces sp. NPDC015032]|uniref:ATP-dependent DNA ligase n=1 Tax=Streptomyces sp. NPDC015032 TaxID=3364937 RepID=UPI0036FCB591